MKKGFIVFVFLMCLFTVTVSADSFTDVKKENWFYEDVMNAVELGYVNGFEDGTFKPNDTITRGEFYKMLVEASKKEPEKVDSATHWAYGYSRFLRENGDTSVQTYNLDEKIVRKEVIRNVLYMFGIKDTVEYCYYDEVPFLDMPNSTIYRYDGYIQNAYQLGVVYGNNSYIEPNEHITRAEAVSIIERALKVDDWTVPKPDVLKGAKITYKGKSAYTYLDDICSGFSKFPDYVIESFVSDDGEIIITDEVIEHHYAGMYIVDDIDIKIFTGGQGASVLFSSVDTVIHELGHYMYFEILSEDDRVELNKIFNIGEEVDILYQLSDDKYCKTDVFEYWSELVCYFYAYKEDKSFDLLPRSYEILQKYLVEDNL